MAEAKKAPQVVVVPNRRLQKEKKEEPAIKVEPQVKEAKTKEKTCYHVSKRDNDGREWKVFIQGSKKVIKLFDTQQEALDYAKNLCKNKSDGSYVMLHRLDGKIRKF